MRWFVRKIHSGAGRLTPERLDLLMGTYQDEKFAALHQILYITVFAAIL
jgi:hypothetical protein